jgi:hypothetical protein
LEIKKSWKLPTGNDLVAIPEVAADSGAVGGINFLSRRFRGLVELSGDGKTAFLEPVLKLGAKALVPAKEKSLKMSRIESWVPFFQMGDGKTFELSWKVTAPVFERGFLLEFTLKNLGGKKMSAFLGARGCWGASRVHAGSSAPLSLERRAACVESDGRRMLVLEAASAGPEFGLALGGLEAGESLAVTAGPELTASARWQAGQALDLAAGQTKPLRWMAGRSVEVQPGESVRTAVLFGLGLDGASARASLDAMRGQGLERLWNRTVRFLSTRQRRTGDPDLDECLNHNLLFNYFHAAGVALDGEELAAVVSRTGEGGGTCRDRDAFFWSFPAVLLLDARRARQLLENVFVAQGRNFGSQSKFLDGNALDPGFSLDQCTAPVIALASYLRNGGDPGLANDPKVRWGLKQCERLLQLKKHPGFSLYESAVSPSGAAESLGYLTYDNALVWRMLSDLAEIKEKGGRDQEARPLRDQAERVRAAVWQNLTAEGPRGRMFVWASDLKGRKTFATEPAGCLQLLPYWGFCEEADLVYKNTVAWVRSREFQYSFAGSPFSEIASPANPHPSILAVANALLSGRREEAKALLARLPLASGLACEAFSEKDGMPLGTPNASMAGFLAWAIWKAYGKVR